MKHGFLYRRVVAPILALLTQGITPEKIALSLAFGIVLGIFPVLGSTTVLCTVAVLLFRLNLPAIQLVNYLIYPLQLLLLMPFLRMGEKLFRVAPMPLSLAQILAMVRTNVPHAISTLWLAEVHAISAWLLVGPPTIVLIYSLLSRMLRPFATSSGPHSNIADVT